MLLYRPRPDLSRSDNRCLAHLGNRLSFVVLFPPFKFRTEIRYNLLLYNRFVVPDNSRKIQQRSPPSPPPPRFDRSSFIDISRDSIFFVTKKRDKIRSKLGG